MFNRSFLRRRKVSNTPQSYLTWSLGASDDYFGYSVALSGDETTAIFGVPLDDTGFLSAGSVVVFIRSGNSWTQQASLTFSASAAGDTLGRSVALSNDGNTAICGMPSKDQASPPLTDCGGVVVFFRSGATWTQQAELQYSARASNDNFGVSVALSSDGNTAICGADQLGTANGKAIVFTRSGATWTEQATLTHSAGAILDFFGCSVALSSDGNTAIVGSRGNDIGANINQGSATVFTRSGAVWTEQQTLTQTSGTVGSVLGTSVSLSSDGNTAICGTPGGGSAQAGVSVVFTRSGATWTQQAVLEYSAGILGDQFGQSVSLSSNGNTVICGAPSADPNGVGQQGLAVVFVRSNTTWTQQATLTYSSGTLAALFGYSVSLSSSGNTATCGAYNNTTAVGFNSGSAHVFYNH